MTRSKGVSVEAGPSSRARPADPLEVRLANAEKQVAIALETFAYDELISVATEALRAKSHTTTSKKVIKARKNLLWARSHAYHHQCLHELALKDAKAALKLDPDDVAAYVRAAVLLSSTGHKAQALSCLDTAKSLSSKCDSNTKALWLRRIDNQRRKVSGASWRLTDRLPNEILIEVALHVYMRDRIAMSQTCRTWRHILTSASSLWRSLHIETNAKALDDRKANDLMRYISLRAERSNHSLEKVVIRDHFHFDFLGPVCRILMQGSTASLKHIEIHARAQDMLYDQLYRHCPRLDSLIFREGTDTATPYFLESFPSSVEAIPAVEATQTVQPFCLTTFDNQLETDHPKIHRHLHKVRIMTGCNPLRIRVEGGEAKFEDEPLARSIMEHLESWAYDPNCYDGQRTSRPLMATFPKLKTLSGFHLEAMQPLRLSLPELLNLNIVLEDESAESSEQLLRMLRTSPRLQRACLTYFGFSFEFPAEHRQALLGLRELTCLNLGDFQSVDFISTLLLPQAVASESGPAEVRVPLPKLDMLIVHAQHTDLSKLAICLLVREHLRAGASLTAARQMASDRLTTLPKAPTAAASPFQRGTSATDPSRMLKNDEGPRLGSTSDCTRLEYLNLSHVLSVPENIKEALFLVCDDLIFEYDNL